MNSDWGLPLIMNQTSKKKYNSISPQKQADSALQNSHLHLPKFYHSMKKNHKARFSQFQLNSNVSTEKYRKTENSTKSKLLNAHFNKENAKNKPQQMVTFQKLTQGPLIQSSFFELQVFIARYFKQQHSQELAKQIQKLSKIIKATKKPIRSVLKLTNERQLVLIDETINILFHQFKAESSLTENNLQAALYHFTRAQYYSLRQNLLLFGIYCLTEQSYIQKQKAELQLQLQCLKKALSLSIQVQRQDITSIILQKIGVTYYYHGNTVMGEYYHLFSQRGLTAKQADLYSRQLRLQRYLAMLKQKLFGISQSPIDQDEWKCKQIDLNALNNQMQFQATENQHFKNLEIVSEMLKDNRSRMIGQKLQSQMRNTMKVAQIHPYKDFGSKNDNDSKELPLINVSRVLKSHLSLNRQKIIQSKRQWQLNRLQQMINL